MKKFLKHPWIIITTCIAITIILGIQLSGVSVENSIRKYMPESSDSYQRLIKTEKDFGSMMSIGISLETTDNTILTPEYIQIIKSITDKIELLDGIDSIDSLSNIDYVYSLDGGLAAGNLLGENYSGKAEEINSLKEKIIDWQEMYQRVIISDDFKAAQIACSLNPSSTPNEQVNLLNKIKDVCAESVKGQNLEVRYYGDPVLSDNASKFMFSDLTRLIPLVALVVLLSLYFSFHTILGTLLPLISVLMATIWTCGIMAWMNITFTIVASVIPVALIACGSAYGIHVITHYYAALKNVEGEMTKEKHLDAICSGLKDVWIAVLLAGITTIAGFISLVTSPIHPLRSFAVFTALGVAFSLILSVTFIPAMLYITPLKNVGKKRSLGISSKIKKSVEREIARRGGKTKEEASGNTLYNIYHFFAGTKPRLVIFSIVMITVSIVGIKKLVVDTSLISYFPKDSEFRKDIDYVDNKFAGTNSLYLLISGQEKGDLTKPEILKAVDDMQIYLSEKHPEIGKAVSFTTFIKRMNQVMHVPVTASQETEEIASEDFNSSDTEYAEDDWGDSAAEEDWAEDDWGDEGQEQIATTENVTPKKVFVDPNVEYAQKLNEKVSVEQMFALFTEAYAKAGGSNATVEKMVTELEKSLNYNGLAYYEIPYDPEKYPAENREELSNLVSQYLLLYSGSLDRFSDDQLAPQTIRMQIQLRSHNTQETKKIINEAKAYAAKYFPEGYSIEATGNGEMEVSMTDMVISSQLTSILFSIGLVFLIIAISFKSIAAGILGAIPLAFTIILNFMVMGFTGIHLDLVTSIIASVAIGVGIDYTIHFMESYKSARAVTDDVELAAINTFKVSGHGIVTNALAVGLGFLVLIFSKFEILRFIGVLAATAMFSSSFLAMTVIPGVLNVFDLKFMHPKNNEKK